jgi:hypothetical protein
VDVTIQEMYARLRRWKWGCIWGWGDVPRGIATESFSRCKPVDMEETSMAVNLFGWVSHLKPHGPCFFLDQYANAYRIFIEGRKYIYKRWKHQRKQKKEEKNWKLKLLRYVSV